MKVLIGTIIAIVVGVIGLQIVNEVITSANLTGLTATVVSFIPVLMAVSILLVSISWAQ